jgi:hypothetical protein
MLVERLEPDERAAEVFGPWAGSPPANKERREQFIATRSDTARRFQEAPAPRRVRCFLTFRKLGTLPKVGGA